MSLFSYQQQIVDDDPKKTGLFLSTGSGKTRIALLLAKGKTLVIAPKMQVLDGNWQREAERNKLSVDLTVISKETFRRDWQALPRFDTVIIEEAHTCLGVTPNTCWRKRVEYPKTSQLFQAAMDFLRETNPGRLYLVTATPQRSAMSVWAAAVLLGARDFSLDAFEAFRRRFYFRLPVPGREIWTPKKDETSKRDLAEVVRSLGYVGQLSDWFDVPEQTERTEWFRLTDKQKRRIGEIEVEFPDPLVGAGKKDQIENGILIGDGYTETEFFDTPKLDRLVDLAVEFPKMLVFAKYTDQIRSIRDRLVKEGRRVVLLTGETKDYGEAMREANDGHDCVVVAQCQVSAGYELPDYPVCVFASLSGSLVDLVQGQGRIHRAHHLKKNLYVYLVMKGGVDEARYKANRLKEDFMLEAYAQARS